MSGTTNRPRSAEDETRQSPSSVLTHVGEYQLVRRIGGGGMGVVYEALHTRLKKRVAVKLLADAQSPNSLAWRRFFREMEVIGKLEQPHVVRATDAGESGGVPYLVMEFVDGSDLARIVREHGPLPPLAALDVVRQAGEALGHIHSHGFVHRDIKPSNLLLDRHGVVKVADLGIAQFACHADDAGELTSLGDVIGTVDYMSPEQSEDSKSVDHRADIYGLGCCLYFLLTGHAVFGKGSKFERLSAHRTQPLPEISTCRGLQ